MLHKQVHRTTNGGICCSLNLLKTRATKFKLMRVSHFKFETVGEVFGTDGKPDAWPYKDQRSLQINMAEKSALVNVFGGTLKGSYGTAYNGKVYSRPDVNYRPTLCIACWCDTQTYENVHPPSPAFTSFLRRTGFDGYTYIIIRVYCCCIGLGFVNSAVTICTVFCLSIVRTILTQSNICKLLLVTL